MYPVRRDDREMVDLLKFFEYDHLPEHLQPIARKFAGLAHTLAEELSGPEVTAGLRKLLEAKDCFVRAKVVQRDTTPAP